MTESATAVPVRWKGNSSSNKTPGLQFAVEQKESVDVTLDPSLKEKNGEGFKADEVHSYTVQFQGALDACTPVLEISPRANAVHRAIRTGLKPAFQPALMRSWMHIPLSRTWPWSVHYTRRRTSRCERDWQRVASLCYVGRSIPRCRDFDILVYCYQSPSIATEKWQT